MSSVLIFFMFVDVVDQTPKRPKILTRSDEVERRTSVHLHIDSNTTLLLTKNNFRYTRI
jgi:hypothetical protein